MTRQLATAFLLTFVLLCSPASADTFDNEADWLASLCTGNSVVEEPYTLDIPDDSFGNIIDNPFPTTWGTFTVEPNNNNGVDIAGDEGLVIDTSIATLTPDSSLGMVNGFALCYAGSEILINVNYVDGTTEAISAPETVDFFTTDFFAWTNTSGVDVASVEMNAAVEGAAFILCTDMAFVDELCVDNPDPTCQQQLDQVIVDLETLLPTGNACDDYYISVAIWKLSSLQDASFWSDEDRLTTAKGHKVFKRSKSAIAWLECTSIDTSAAVDSIVATLGCIVDIEIQDAIDAGGSSCYIAYAEYYRQCALDAIAAGNDRAAAGFFKWAWLYARYS